MGLHVVQGLGLPSEMLEYTGADDAHSCPYFYLWDMQGLGKLSAYTTMSLVKEEITGALDESFTAGDHNLLFQKLTMAVQRSFLASRFSFTKNIEEYAELY